MHQVEALRRVFRRTRTSEVECEALLDVLAQELLRRG